MKTNRLLGSEETKFPLPSKTLMGFIGIVFLFILVSTFSFALEFDDVTIQPSGSNTTYQVPDTLQSLGINSTHILIDGKGMSFQSDSSNLATITSVKNLSGYYQIFLHFATANTFTYLTDSLLFKNDVLVDGSSFIVNSFADILRYSEPKQNYVYFYDQDTTLPLENNTVIVTYPDASTETLTTDALGKVEFNSYYNDAIQLGEYEFEYTNNQGYNSYTFNYTPSTLPFNVSYNATRVNITFNIFYRESGLAFDKNVSIFFEGIGNFTTDNGSYLFNDLNLTSGDYNIKVFSDNYFTEQKVITITNQENLWISIYLLEQNLTTSNTLKVNVVDEAQSKIENAEVNLLEYDPVSLSYIGVSQCFTDSDGICKFLIELNDKTYRYTASKIVDSNLLTASSGDEGVIFREDIAGGSPITFSELEVSLVLQQFETYIILDSNYLIYNITENFNETTNISQVSVDFQTTDGSTVNVCVQFFNTDKNPDTSALTKCVESNAGSVTPLVPFTLNRSNNYRLDVYSISSDGTKTALDTFYYKSITSLQSTLELYAILSPFILFLWIALISIGLYSGVLPILAILGIVLAVAETILFPNFMIVTGMVLKILICLQIIYFGRKKEDLK